MKLIPMILGHQYGSHFEAHEHAAVLIDILVVLLRRFAGALPSIGGAQVRIFGAIEMEYSSIGYFFTCASTLVTMKRTNDKTQLFRIMAILGTIFSTIFMILQLVPIPMLDSVNIGRESYIMLFVWIILGYIFYRFQKTTIKES